MLLNFTAIFWVKKLQKEKLDNFIEWNIDPDGGFAPWRDWADQLNHQNTTIDHSYYLNSALMDGFFLSGSSTANDYTKENTAMNGHVPSIFMGCI